MQSFSGSVVNYGLIGFAGMCMTSDTDQKRICTAVQPSLQRYSVLSVRSTP